MSGRQVQQQTFDAIVREAMEEFGLSPEEAMVDAKEQLAKTGITDFSNLCTSSLSSSTKSDQRAEGLTDALKSALDANEDAVQPDRALFSAVTELATAAEAAEDLSGLAGAHGAVELAVRALERAHEKQARHLIGPSCSLIFSLCMRDDANRARFVVLETSDGVSALKNVLKTQLTDGDDADDATFETMLHVSKAIMAVQRRSELVKQRIAEGESLVHLLAILRCAGDYVVSSIDRSGAKNALRVFSTMCVLLRQFLSADDTSVEVSEAFSRARVLSGAYVVTEGGLSPLTGDNMITILASLAECAMNCDVLKGRMRQSCLSECISTTRACAQTDDICKQLFKLNLHEICFECLREFGDEDEMVAVSFRFIRNLAARDECKTSLASHLDVLQDVAQKHIAESSKVAEMYCAILAQLSLRRVDISREMATGGIMDGVVDIMRIHMDRKEVLSAACLSIRNVCSRDDVARRRMRDNVSAEKMLRDAWRAFPRACDVAYYALLEMNVLADEELRRDSRYTMPAGFYSIKTSQESR